MTIVDFKTFINGVGNDLKIAIDDVIEVISNIQEDVEKLKIRTSKPDKTTAKALLEYIAMEECQAKKNMEVICSKEIQQYLKWIDEFCKEHHCTQEQALNQVINGEI
jgi:hypothetical protein